MTPETVLTIGREALYLAVLLAAPMLLISLVVGVVVGMVQAATQINEMTLSFIPKLAALALVVALTGPWMLRTLVDFTRRLIQDIPSLIG